EKELAPWESPFHFPTRAGGSSAPRRRSSMALRHKVQRAHPGLQQDKRRHVSITILLSASLRPPQRMPRCNPRQTRKHSTSSRLARLPAFHGLVAQNGIASCDRPATSFQCCEYGHLMEQKN